MAGFKKAKKEKIFLKILLAGASGSGKSFSALRLATGIANKTGGRIAAIDTEAGRIRYYANEFDFDDLQLTEPYTPEKYIDAINVAMGARAYSIVVDSQDVAYRAIQVLRSQGRDRASFIPMDIIKKAPSRMVLPKSTGVIDFAINLIDFDDEYLDAFYFALGETIVVENEAAAKKLAGKYRVVTLEGDITEKSGLITGGAKKKTMGLFDKTQERELEKHKKLYARRKREG